MWVGQTITKLSKEKCFFNHHVLYEFKGMQEEADQDDSIPLPLHSDDILFVIGEVAKALDYLHTQKRILHGDIKSANILIKGDFEEVKLCDFGVTLDLDENLKVLESSFK